MKTRIETKKGIVTIVKTKMGLAFYVPKNFRGADLEKFKEKNADIIKAMRKDTDVVSVPVEDADALTPEQQKAKTKTAKFYISYIKEHYKTAPPAKGFLTKEIRAFNDELMEYKEALQRPSQSYLGQVITPAKIDKLEAEIEAVKEIRENVTNYINL